MKKIINNIGLLFIGYFLLIACSNKKEGKNPNLNANEIIQQVDTVIAIGKVSAENGIAFISPKVSAMINKINIKEGDSIKKGMKLIELADEIAQIDIDLANKKLKSLEVQNKITQKDISVEYISLKHLEEKYKTSKTLFEKQAETKEIYLNDESNYLQQKQRVESLQQQLKINGIQADEQKLNISKSNITLDQYNITAPQNGIVTSINAHIGQIVNSNEVLGEIIDPNKIIIDAEVDELFAESIAIGQEVTFININTKQNLGKGTITYSSPTLVNKSILYETANEGNDRRVLPIKIQPSTNTKLLINTKVECQIKIK